MSKQNNGGPAFPVTDDVARNADGVLTFVAPGMTLRDYFAAKAMQGMLSDADFDAPAKRIAYSAYLMADAMLAARKGDSE